MPATAISYENRFVAYIDILGWSDASVACTSEVVEAIELIHGKAASFSSRLKASINNRADEDFHVNPVWLDAQVGAFSDNIVLSHSADSGFRTVAAAGSLQRALLAIGFLSRGGITYGPVFHRDAIIMGPALVEAVRLEKQADIPRVVVSSSALDIMLETEGADNALQRELYDDGSGLLAVNPIAPPASFSRDHEQMYRQALSINHLEAAIADGLRASAGNQRHLLKWQYMASIFPVLLERSIRQADGSRG